MNIQVIHQNMLDAEKTYVDERSRTYAMVAYQYFFIGTDTPTLMRVTGLKYQNLHRIIKEENYIKCTLPELENQTVRLSVARKEKLDQRNKLKEEIRSLLEHKSKTEVAGYLGWHASRLINFLGTKGE